MMVCVIAMNSEAGTPLPQTSPIVITTRFPSNLTTSYRSPPTSRAGTMCAKISSRPSAKSLDCMLGSIAR